MQEEKRERMARRPSGLMRQLDCLWEGVEELREQAGQDDGGTVVDGTTPTDPGDLSVYFENGLAGS